MTEVDADAQIRNYWVCREKLIPEEFREFLKEKFREFRDATEDNPVGAADFLYHLDMSCARDFLRSLYGREPTFPAEAIVKAFFYMDLNEIRFYTKLESELIADERDAENLGFPRKDGIILIPSYKTLWHFDNIRMGCKWDILFKILRDGVVREGKSLGLHIGEETVGDSMPIESFSNDEEAEYNDYYKIKGYKLDTITDRNTGIPLSKKTIGINEDESKCLIPHLKELRKAGIDVRDHWMDGGYADYPNIAWMGVNGIMPHHPIHKNWKRNEKGDVFNLLRLYQKNWKHPKFKPKAGLGYILSFLLEMGYEEEVGAFFRNASMYRYESNPDDYLKDYHKRSRQEGNHGYWKEHLQLEKRLRRKGMRRVDGYLTRNLCAILAVALCRLQNGVKNNLTSVAYIT